MKCKHNLSLIKVIRQEDWNGHKVRFVEKDGEWWAVAKDICDALDIQNVTDALIGMPDPYLAKSEIGVETGKKKDGSPALQDVGMNIISELGVYRLIMRSNKPEALDFQDWVYRRIKDFREAMGYEQWKIKAFMDSVERHHIDMRIIKEALNPDDKVPYIKSHTVTNKVMANLVGESKAISKDDLKAKYPQMIPVRDDVLSDVTDLMRTAKRFDMDISISETIYKKYQK